jgi:hypothetical protein
MTRKAKTHPYQEEQAEVLEALEGLPLVRGPSIREYHDMLVEFRKEVDDWFDASIDAAAQDMKRQGERG